MRVIEAKMIAAVLTGSSMKSGNTEVTTRNRLNALEIPGRVHCVRGTPMLDGRPISAVDWF